MKYSWSKKIAFGIFVAVAITFVSQIVGDFAVKPKLLIKSAYRLLATKQAATNSSEVSKKAKDVINLLESANLNNGKKVFKKCKACHSAKVRGRNKLGPNLWGVFGKPIGSAENFKYSSVMKSRGEDWGVKNLDQFLANPKQYFPGTKMSFSGLSNASDRIDVIGFLKSLNNSQ